MKKTIFTLIAFLVIGNAYATVRRVNNNVGVVTVAGLVYSTIESCITDAVNGDTIYLEPSINPYHPASGVITLTKRLTFIGNGYQIGQNVSLINPLPFNTNESVLGNGNLNINVNVGAENSSFIGITFYTNSITVNAGNTIWKRCKFKNGMVLSSANNLIEQSLFSGLATSLGGNSSAQNNTVKNCVIQTLYGHNSTIFDNCYIHSINNFGPHIQNCVFTNCIVNLFSTSPDPNNTFTNCLKIGGTFPIAGINNNLENVTLASIFIVSDPLTIVNSEVLDKNFRLKLSTSPAIGTGISGVDMGPFGGATPYRLSGQPPVPVITNFFLSTTGSTASGLTGSITIQSNN